MSEPPAKDRRRECAYDHAEELLQELTEEHPPWQAIETRADALRAIARAEHMTARGRGSQR